MGPPIKTKKVALYLRVSTNLQNTDMQKNDLLEYCKLRKFEIYKIYEDIFTGAKENRPNLNKLMDDARKRKFDIILVWRFDRFARSTKHLLMALEEFQHLSIDFISYQENIDTSTPLGKAMFSIISALSELERNTIRERVTKGIENAKRKGKILGRPKMINDSSVLELRKKGLSYRAIARQLNASLGSVQRSLKLFLNSEIENLK